jgi:hypothetical protein
VDRFNLHLLYFHGGRLADQSRHQNYQNGAVMNQLVDVVMGGSGGFRVTVNLLMYDRRIAGVLCTMNCRHHNLMVFLRKPHYKDSIPKIRNK